VNTRTPLIRRTTAAMTVLAFAAASSPASALGPQEAPQATPRPAGRQSRLQIQHEPLACVTTVAAPAVDAFVNPGPDVSVGFVLFRAPETTPYFYYVVMKGAPPSLEGVLPRVENDTKAVEYHIEATDKVQLSRQTPDYVAPVVTSTVCKAKGVPAPAGGLGLTIGLTNEKQNPVPPGFKKEDIAKVILVNGTIVSLVAALQSFSSGGGAGAGAGTSGAAGAGAGAAGASAGAAAGAAAAGAGISTGVIVGAGAIAAAGISYGVYQAVKSSATPTHTATPTRTPTITPRPFQFIEVDATWSGPGQVDIQLFNGNNPVNAVPTGGGCDTAASRTRRIFVQAASLPPAGNYHVTLMGSVCPSGTAGFSNPPPASITTIVTVQTDSGQKCSMPVSVPVPGQKDSGCPPF
jgi:hypothetical protein